MLDLAFTPPARRPDLIIRTGEDSGGCVIKDPATANYYRFGTEETFLLQQLDGRQSAQKICGAFQQRFGTPLEAAELQHFIDQARTYGLLQAVGRGVTEPPAIQNAPPPAAQRPATQRQSLLYWRLRLINPDALITALQPLVSWVYSPAMLIFISLIALGAGVIAWVNHAEMISQFPKTIRWGMFLCAWLTLAATTLCHEFSHGFACKKYGGEVRDMGFLLMFLMPCFYCNVSDAWLFPKRSQRITVTLAGPLCDLLLWSLAVFAWRLTIQDSLPHFVAWAALSILGVRLILNFNPLMKLDGYYLLSDWIEIPNLRDRSWAYVRGLFRWLVLGAQKPQPETRPLFLFFYGMASWWYGFLAVCLGIVFVGHMLIQNFGWLGAAGAALFAWLLLRGMCTGFFAGELSKMILTRHVRTACCTAMLGCAASALCLTTIDDTAGGTLLLRASSRAEIRAPVAGFLAEVFAQEGEQIGKDAQLIRLSMPDLASRIAQKQAELTEMDAKLRLLSAGPRAEEEAEQRGRIERAAARVTLAEADLKQRRAALESELAEIELRVKQFKLEAEWASENFRRVDELFKKGANSKWERDECQKKAQVFQSQCEQAQAQREARKALGVSVQEAELARWQHELAEARSQLVLMTARPHSEELDAAAARVLRLREEIACLEEIRQKLNVHCGIRGVLATPRLSQNVGQFYKEGELICEVEDPNALDAEVVVSEQDAARISSGQTVQLTVRGLLLDTVEATVISVAPKAVMGQAQNSFVVRCRLKNQPPALRPGMTGNARIVCGRKQAGEILVDRALRLLRAEFWW